MSAGAKHSNRAMGEGLCGRAAKVSTTRESAMAFYRNREVVRSVNTRKVRDRGWQLTTSIGMPSSGKPWEAASPQSNHDRRQHCSTVVPTVIFVCSISPR